MKWQTGEKKIVNDINTDNNVIVIINLKPSRFNKSINIVTEIVNSVEEKILK